MGSVIEINDTLVLTRDASFPAELNLEAHVRGELSEEGFKGRLFDFSKDGERLYHRPPTRVFLVEEVEKKWLYWGHVLIPDQRIVGGRTEGRFEIVKVYDPEYQVLATINESPKGRCYFVEEERRHRDQVALERTGRQGEALAQRIMADHPEILKDHKGSDLWIDMQTEEWAVGPGLEGVRKLEAKVGKDHGDKFYSRGIGYIPRV